MSVDIALTNARLRSWRVEDAAALARHANNANIAANLRDGFPHPYQLEHAERFIAAAPATFLAIEVDGEAAGGIGLSPGRDIERFSAELGYWLSEMHWGRGIITESIAALSRHTFASSDIRRIFALPFATNEASARVLEKCGYVLEGRLRMSAFKGGRFVDQLLYARIDPPR